MAVTGNTAVASIDEIDGVTYITYEVTETSAAAADEWSIPLPPGGQYTLHLYQAELQSGTGTTIQPEIGIAAAWTVDDLDHVVQASAADASQRISDSVPISIPGDDPPTLYVRSTVDAAADNTIATRITLILGKA
jgi:hypothetical protein